MYTIEKNFAPESSFDIDNDMSMDKICKARTTGGFLVGHVIMWNSEKEFLQVSLGNNFHGILPLEEATIYPIKTSPYFTVGATIYSMVGKKICITVKDVSEDAIVLSRKDNLLKAFEYIKKNSKQTFIAQITSLKDCGTFGDIGLGLTGLIPYKELTAARIAHPTDAGFELKQYITVKIAEINPGNYHISLDHKTTCKNISLDLRENDIIVATSLARVNSDGFFGHVNPNTTAIIDVPQKVDLPYGSRVICRVKTTKSDKLKLDFISFAFD